MSLDKAIKSGKEHRRKFYGAKAVDNTCRNHGSCSYCEGSRTFSNRREESRLDGQEDEYFCYWMHPDPYDAVLDVSDQLLIKFGICDENGVPYDKNLIYLP